MNEKMLRFLKSINIDNIDDFDLDFEMVGYDRFNPKQLNMVIVKSSPWEYELLHEFMEGLNCIEYKYTLSFSYIVRPIFTDVISLFEQWHESVYHIPSSVSLLPQEKEGNLLISYPNEEIKEKEKSIVNDFRDFLNFINYDFVITEVVEKEEEKVNLSKREMKKIEKEAIIASDKAIEEFISEEKESPSSDNDISKNEEEKRDQLLEIEDEILEEMRKNKKQMDIERERYRRNKRGNYELIEKIDDINDKTNSIDFSCTIYQIETKAFGGRIKLTLGVNDSYGGAIHVVMNDNAQVNAEFIDKLKVKTNLRVRGVAYVDEFTKQVSVRGHYLDLLPPDTILADEAEEKRVELHLHSNMSNQDGITSMEDYVKYAVALGHKALAITDHGVVQAFPDAQNAAKGKDIKILYGVEFYMIDDSPIYIKNPANIPLSKATYVVFDLETTGLSVKYDRIMEFGAIKVSQGVIVDRLDILINPEMEISTKIQNITNISNELVQGQPTIREVMPKLLDFIGDAVLVTHNAQFDVSFMQENLNRLGMNELTNPVIDTLALSRYLFPESTRHSLGALCRNMEIDYDEDSAHRADYDAEVLNNVWQAMIEKLLLEKRAMTHADLEKLSLPEEYYKHIRTNQCHHVIALAKNQAGIRDLYELVSISHTSYFSEVPKLPRKELERLRGNLLLGSACFNGEVYETARYYNKERLKNTIKFYDYIEVQPPENYSYLVNMEEITPEQSILLINDIIEASDEMHKLVVATGDVHYLTPKDKIFRDVYISSQAVGGINHPLNPYSRSKMAKKFDNPDQHFRLTNEMLECFSFLGKEKAYEIVVKNTNLIADQIEAVMPAPNDHLYTPFIEGCDDMLRNMCFDKAHEIYGDPLPELIEKRLTRELNGIIDNGYSVVYYLAHRLVKKTNEDGHIVGSRGSVGSSFAATMAGITEVNPLPPHYICPKCKKLIWGKDIGSECASGYDLPDINCPDCGTPMNHDGQNIPFETFLGFNADKTPDIDLNFPSDYQPTAHEYTKVLVGEHNVFRAGTIETVKDKTAFGFARGYLERKFKGEGLSEEEAKQKVNAYPKAKIEYLASGCIDVRRTTGQHPGGIVVVPNDHKIYDFTPIQYPADDQESKWQTTHFDFEKIHDTLLKLDMLGHVDPLALKMMCDLTGVDLKSIPFNDPKVLSLFSSSEALGMKHDYLGCRTGAIALPEFGTETTRRTLEATTPKTFSDLVIISGLSHGTGVWAGNADELIKSGVATLQTVIGCRDDIMTYLISKGLDPYVSFVIMETVRKKNKFLKPEQIEAMRANNVPQYYIDSCNKIEYLFPKGHACAYVIMAVRVAYFKLYYPLEFYATFFSVRTDQYEIETMIKGEEAIKNRLDELKLKDHLKGEKLSVKEKEIVKTLTVALEMYQRGYKFSNIDINRSDASKFVVDKENNALIPSFITIDGLGVNNAQTVIDEREKSSFTSKEDLQRRTSLSSTNIQDLDRLGALADLGESDQLSLFDFGF